jgi:hypothetical protein
MEMSERRARRAYELGRLRVGLQAAWPLVFLTPLALALHGNPRLVAPIAIFTALLTTVLGWRGGGLERGARFGFLAGLPLLLVPWLVMFGQDRCEDCNLVTRGAFPHGAAWTTCMIACALTGLAVGAVIGWRAARDARGPRFATSAAAVAGLTGALGCAMVGVTGVLGVLGGLAVAAPPTLLVSRRLRAS